MCANGILFVWLIAEAEDSQEFTHTVLFQSSLAEAAQRVVWHPRSTFLAVACGAQVNLMSCADDPPASGRDLPRPYRRRQRPVLSVRTGGTSRRPATTAR